jgi:hypothetical protein
VQLSIDWLIFMAVTAAVLSAFGIVLLDTKQWCTGLAGGFAAAAVVIWAVTRDHSHFAAAFIVLVCVVGVLIRFWPLLLPQLQRSWPGGSHLLSAVMRARPDRGAEATGEVDCSANGTDAQKVAELIVFVQHGEWMIGFNEKVFGPYESEEHAIGRANHFSEFAISKGLSSYVVINRVERAEGDHAKRLEASEAKNSSRISYNRPEAGEGDPARAQEAVSRGVLPNLTR